MKTDALYEAMTAAADPSQVEGLSRFFKCGPGQYGEGDKFLGIKVPVTRALVKRCWRTTDFDELERCISSEYHEIRLAALLALVEIFRHAGTPRQAERSDESLRSRCIGFYLSHTAYINNWDLVDLSCYPLLGEWFLPRHDRDLLYDLARSGRTLWEQRIGIVSTITFVRHGQIQDTFNIADILLHHPHDLIHKAVGWLLREAGKRDGAALEAYLQGALPGTAVSRYRQMPRTMLRYAIEKFPENDRQRYLHGEA
ncbi:MAG: DNA alkylation repair protein [Bacteroidales bacterium]|nr:DNA alkylation repair protein [Bacteroidales bacterium]